jgi:hypothetical protein
MSALQFQKLLGLTRYETAFQMLHKLRAALIRPARDGIGGEWPVEVDETWVGGATQGEGRGRHHKTLVVGAVEVRPRAKAPGPDPNLPAGQSKPPHRGGHGRGIIAGRLRLQVAPGRTRNDLEPFVLAAVAPGSLVRTDGWSAYDNLTQLAGALGHGDIQGSVRIDQYITARCLHAYHPEFNPVLAGREGDGIEACIVCHCSRFQLIDIDYGTGNFFSVSGIRYHAGESDSFRLLRSRGPADPELSVLITYG